jgi:hypothetical protein
LHNSRGDQSELPTLDLFKEGQAWQLELIVIYPPKTDVSA